MIEATPTPTPIRASMTPTADKCTGSIVLKRRGLPHDDYPAPAAESGSRIHRAIASAINAAEKGTPLTASGFIEKDDWFVFNTAMKMWENGADESGFGLREYFPLTIETEYHVPDPEFPGTMDVVGYDSTRLVVLDWKTGRVRRPHWPQLKTYAAKFMDARGINPREIYLCTAWPRFGEAEWIETTPAELTLFLSTLRDKVIMSETADPADLTIYTEGRHCEYCPALLHCPARKAALLALETDLIEIDATALTDDQIARAYTRMKAINRVCEAVDGMIREAVRQRGEIPLDDGMILKFKPGEKAAIKPATARPILDKSLTPDEIDGATTISITKVMDAVKAKAGRGEKGKVAAALREELDAAGALDKKPYETLSACKPESEG